MKHRRLPQLSALLAAFRECIDEIPAWPTAGTKLTATPKVPECAPDWVDEPEGVSRKLLRDTHSEDDAIKAARVVFFDDIDQGPLDEFDVDLAAMDLAMEWSEQATHAASTLHRAMTSAFVGDFDRAKELQSRLDFSWGAFLDDISFDAFNEWCCQVERIEEGLDALIAFRAGQEVPA